MTRIVVDRNELKGIRDNIEHLLQKGKQSFAIEAQRPIYESDDLNEKEQLIINHLNKNPGINKEKVVGDLKDDGARVTIRNRINGLIEKGLIIPRRDKIKKRTYHLFVNYQNIIYSLKEDLGFFKFFYFQLLDEVVPIINNLLLKKQENQERVLKAGNLFNAMVGPYKYLCIMYITSDIFLWHKRPLDDDTLHRKFAIFFKTTKEIHAKLLKKWPDSEFGSPITHILSASPFGLYELRMLHMLKTFEEYQLSVLAEPLVDVLWKISYPILPLIDPSYNEYLESGILKDWRKVLENNPKSNYKPKTQLWHNL